MNTLFIFYSFTRFPITVTDALQVDALYIQSIEGFMQLLKMTLDDVNFQAYVKQRLNYLMDRAERCTNNLST